MPSRAFFLILIWFYSGLLFADWSGISLGFENGDADFQFKQGQRNARLGQIKLQFEEKTATEMGVGISIGHMSLRFAATDFAEAQKFDSDFIGIYLHQPFIISNTFSMHARLAFQLNTGLQNTNDNAVEIDWTQTDLELGANLKLSKLRVTPYIVYQYYDGDISSDSGTEIFDLQEPWSSGLRFDYFLERTAFIRFGVLRGDRSAAFLSFAREY